VGREGGREGVRKVGCGGVFGRNSGRGGGRGSAWGGGKALGQGVGAQGTVHGVVGRGYWGRDNS